MHAPVVTGLYLAAVVLLGLAGVAKLARPGDQAAALAAAGLPSDRRLVRLGAGAEVVLGAAGLVAPGPVPGAVVAAAYAAFAAFVAVAIAKGWPLSSCGCFARPDTPPRRLHVVLDLAAAGAAVAWVAAGPHSVPSVLDAPTAPVVALLSATTALVVLGYVAFTMAPGVPAGPGRGGAP